MVISFDSVFEKKIQAPAPAHSGVPLPRCSAHSQCLLGYITGTFPPQLHDVKVPANRAMLVEERKQLPQFQTCSHVGTVMHGVNVAAARRLRKCSGPVPGIFAQRLIIQ
jgi:hypothetical protein